MEDTLGGLEQQVVAAPADANITTSAESVQVVSVALEELLSLLNKTAERVESRLGRISPEDLLRGVVSLYSNTLKLRLIFLFVQDVIKGVPRDSEFLYRYQMIDPTILDQLFPNNLNTHCIKVMCEFSLSLLIDHIAPSFKAAIDHSDTNSKDTPGLLLNTFALNVDSL